ncbi:transposable element Tcb1 transposase [Trichonephila clavipes]|nr:transposable element Tcb1 transposase [Trichonephila clavipes]
MDDPETLSLVEETVKVVDYLCIIQNQMYPYTTSVILNGNGIFQLNSIPCQKTGFVLEGFEEHKGEFQSISWPPNSTDLNLIGHLWVFIEKQLSDQISSCWNMSTLATIAYTIDTTCVQSTTKNLWDPCQGELQLFGGQKGVK